MCRYCTKTSPILSCTVLAVIASHLDWLDVGAILQCRRTRVAEKELLQPLSVNLTVCILRQAIQRQPSPRQHVVRELSSKRFAQADDGNASSFKRSKCTTNQRTLESAAWNRHDGRFLQMLDPT